MKKTKLLMPLAGVTALGAVVPVIMTTTSCNNSSYVNETDKTYLDTINTYLGRNTGLISPHKAVDVLKNLGYDVQNYNLSNSSSQFAYDASAKRFIIMHGDNVVASPANYSITNNQSIFKFTKTYDANSKFGQYLMDDYELPSNSTTLEVKTSLDVGNNQNVDKIKFVGDEDTEKYILLRTCSEVVEINASKNTVFHMGIANNIQVTADATTSPNFYEVGQVAYLKTTNVKLNTVVLSGTEAAKIDVLENTNTSIGEKWNEASLTAYTTAFKGLKQPEKDPVAVTPVTAAPTTALTSGIYRLSKGIILTQAITLGDDATVVIDLNGQTLESTLTAETVSIIVAGGQTLEIIDSSLEGTGKIISVANYVQVAGDSTNGKTAALWIEGGNYDFTGAEGKRSGFILIGETTETSKSILYSRFYMNGGKINTHLATGVESSHSNQGNGLYVKYNSYVQITHGTIQSTEVCIRGTGTFSGHDCYIDIYGGNLIQTSDKYGECIFQPQGGDLNIYGGTLIGRSCIATKNSSVNISGGYLHAWGDKQDLTPTTTEQEQDSDGSVLCMELTAKSYGTNPSITVHNATLYSEKSYILQVYGEERAEGQGQHLAEADFFGGVYYYAVNPSAEGETTLYKGVRIAADVEDDVRINQYGGSWVKF